MSSRRAARPRAETAQATREALLDAARTAFAEDGFDAPSLDAICTRAGLTRGAFYVHFRDREALVVAVVSRVVERFLDAMIAAGGASETLGGAVRRFADTVAAATAARRGGDALVLAGLLPLHRILEAARRSPAIRSRLVEIAHDARDRVAVAAAAARSGGALRDDIAPEAVGAVLIGLALGVLVGAEVGVPMELETLRGALHTLLAAPAGARPSERPRPRARRR